MKNFKPGLVHTPVTPFHRDQSIDFDTYAKIIEFHLRNGAEALALPMPEGEDLSLTDEEQRKLLEFAIRQVKDRVPVIAHVSDAGTAIAVARARHAESAGAAAIVSHPPYFWHPKPAMIVEHLVEIGSAVRLPFLICNRSSVIGGNPPGIVSTRVLPPDSRMVLLVSSSPSPAPMRVTASTGVKPTWRR